MFILRKVAKQNSAATAKKLSNKVSESSCHVVIIAKRFRWKRKNNKSDFWISLNVFWSFTRLSPRFVCTTANFSSFSWLHKLRHDFNFETEKNRRDFDVNWSFFGTNYSWNIRWRWTEKQRRVDLHNQLQRNYFTRISGREQVVDDSEKREKQNRTRKFSFYCFAFQLCAELNLFSPFDEFVPS